MGYYYKFRQVNDYSLSALENCQLWFDKLSNQNDPFEGGYKLTFSPTAEQRAAIDKYFNHPKQKQLGIIFEATGLQNPASCSPIELSEYYIRALAQKAVRHLQECLICSMSSSNTHDTDDVKDPIENTLMWGHYAGGLRGFCLVFDEEKITHSIFENTQRQAYPTAVRYSDEPANFEATNIVTITNNIFAPNTDADILQMLLSVSATKSLDWKGENEVRFLSHSGEQLVSYEAQALVKVIIGDKMPSEDKAKLKAILDAKYPHIEIKTAKTKRESYELMFV
ncbi:DUF2971 domain-containing protein [Vibrio campbellii]|uniref:DUF2971 domain-containing protein n=1 Tax=Vibrio campbellii TaxID=680 RepID=UPI003CE58B0C